MERISIHALREEGDLRKRLLRPRPWNFYPRPPRGGRHSSIGIKRGSRLFLSTPSARRATPSTTLPKSNTRNFYPRPPRGGRRYSDVPLDDHVRISIHALREEGDCPSGSYSHKHDVFLSTPSARRATTISSISRTTMHISIHALREEGDLRAFASTLGALRISIHALREEGDRLWSTDTVGRIRFLSTPSARRATSHALREEGDLENIANKERQDLFLSTPSARRATRRKASRLHCLWAISIHALREEGDQALWFDGCHQAISIHALREEGDPRCRKA